MNIVTVNGKTYLATIEKNEDGDITLQNAMQVGGFVSQREITEYYKAMNLGSLQPVSFGGSGVSYSIETIGDDVVMFCKIADLAIEQAKKVAIKNLENREFESVLGKM